MPPSVVLEAFGCPARQRRCPVARACTWRLRPRRAAR